MDDMHKALIQVLILVSRQMADTLPRPVVPAAAWR